MQAQVNPDKNQDNSENIDLNKQSNNQNEIVVILRCTKDGEQDHWQCSMKNIYTGESKFFMSIRQFEAYMNSVK